MSTLVPAWHSVEPSGPAQRLAGWVAQKHAHAGFLSRRQEAGPDYRNDIDLRQIQSFRLLGDTGRGVLKRGSDNTAIKVVQTGPGQSEKRNMRTRNNLVIALSALAIPLQIPSGVPCVRQLSAR